MADNVNITEGTGTVIATDQVGATHFQKVKLVDGTAESATVIAAGGGVEAGALRVTIASDSTGVVSVDDNGGALTVDGTVTANLGATDNAVLDDIAAKLATIDADTSTLAGAVSTEVQVDVVGALPAGTNTIGKLAANSGVDIGDVDILSIAAGTNNIGSVAPYAQPGSFVSGVTTSITDDTATSVIAAQGDGVVIYITSIMVTNADDTTGTFVNITDGSAGTTMWSGYAAALGGGYVVNLNIPLKFTANTAVYAKCETTGATVRVNAAGYKL